MPTAERRAAPAAAWPALALGVGWAGGVLLRWLRLWGVRQGLPYAYNADEADHFVPHAVAMFGHGLNPHYFANPPAFTYVLHYLFAHRLRRRARRARTRSRCTRPSVYTLARVAAARARRRSRCGCCTRRARACSAARVGAARRRDRGGRVPAGLLRAPRAQRRADARAADAVAARHGRRAAPKGGCSTTLLAGIGLGLACATKYTAGIVVLPLLAAVAIRYLDDERTPRAARGSRAARAAARGGARVRGVLGREPVLAARLLELSRRTGAPVDAVGRSAGQARRTARGRLRLLPVVVHLGARLGAGARGARRRGGDLATAAGARLAARAGAAAVPRVHGHCRAATSVAGCCRSSRSSACWRRSSRCSSPARSPAASRDPRRGGATRTGARARAGGAARRAALAQGLVYSVHSGLVLSRADTRNVTRAWMLANMPAGAQIVAEPVSPDGWARERPGSLPGARTRIAGTSTRRSSRGSPPTARSTPARRIVGIEDYERTLSPALLGYYEQHGYCWVMSGSTESGRAFADPRAVPLAIAYYRALERAGRSRLPRLAVRARRRPGRVRLRLELRLLPARVRAAGTGR